MKSRTQLAWVKQQLRANGQISRNEALANYISRLGAIILVLKKEGWEIDSGYDGHRNYVYKLKSAPIIRKVVVVGGKAVEITNQPKQETVW